MGRRNLREFRMMLKKFEELMMMFMKKFEEHMMTLME